MTTICKAVRVAMLMLLAPPLYVCSAATEPLFENHGGNEPNEVWRTDRFCGVNSAYVFLRLKNIDVDYDDVQHALNPTDTGNSLAEIDGVLDQYLNSNVVKMTSADLSKARLPIIVLVDTEPDRQTTTVGHFVVVIRIEGERVFVIDGTTATVQEQSRERFVDGWTGYAIKEQSGNPMIRIWLTVIIVGGIIATIIIPRFRTLSRLVIFALLLTIPASAANAQTTQQWAKTLSDHSGNLRDISIEYESVSKKQVLQGFPDMHIVEKMNSVFVRSGERIFFEEFVRDQRSSYRRMFDGTSLFVQRGDNVTEVFDRDAAIRSGSVHFNCVLLNLMGYYVADPTASPELEHLLRETSVPHILNSRRFDVPSTNDSLVLAELPNDDQSLSEVSYQFVVDPLRKALTQTIRRFRGKPDYVLISMADFELVNDVPIPKLVIVKTITPDGELLKERVHTVTKLDVEVADALFDGSTWPKPGSLLFDFRGSSSRAEDTNVQGRLVGATKQAFDHSISQAAKMRSDEDNQGNISLANVMTLMLGVFCILFVALFLRKNVIPKT